MSDEPDRAEILAFIDAGEEATHLGAVAEWLRTLVGRERWIPLAERLPEESGYYLACRDTEHENFITEAHYRADGHPRYRWEVTPGDGAEEFDFHPTHWRPLPIPPAPIPKAIPEPAPPTETFEAMSDAEFRDHLRARASIPMPSPWPGPR